MVDCETESPQGFRQVLHVREHVFHADVTASLGSTDSAPGPHDYFDAALASCKALTATWYAKRNGIPLERVESHVVHDDSKEREGVYRLTVKLAFHGSLTPEQRARLYNAAARCPVHKLMTTAEVVIDTEPLAEAS